MMPAFPIRPFSFSPGSLAVGHVDFHELFAIGIGACADLGKSDIEGSSAIIDEKDVAVVGFVSQCLIVVGEKGAGCSRFADYLYLLHAVLFQKYSGGCCGRRGCPPL